MATKEQVKKFSVVKFIVLTLFLGLTATAFVFSSDVWGEFSVFNTVVSENSFVQTLYIKIPALIRSVQIVTLAVTLNIVVKFVLAKLLTKNKRGLTIVKLLSSLLKWVILILALLLVLGAWGVNTTTLVASAGIVSLVVGLGAQSLIADIIAGLFIVIEGEYQVGDIVVIDDWRGTVREIGIRTTKIEDAGGNVKIVNNSEIKTLVNQTQSLSVAKSIISIEYGESIPKVELVIRDNIDKIKENIPDIKEGPFYKGVNALSASSVDLLFIAKCDEENIFQVQRDLNKELKMLFDANGINIPFPQIVLNQRERVESKTVKKVEKEAREFANEQRELSKGIEEKED